MALESTLCSKQEEKNCSLLNGQLYHRENDSIDRQAGPLPNNMECEHDRSLNLGYLDTTGRLAGLGVQSNCIAGSLPKAASVLYLS